MDTAESAGFAEVCVTIVSGVLQSDLEVVVALDVAPIDAQGEVPTHTYTHTHNVHILHCKTPTHLISSTQILVTLVQD